METKFTPGPWVGIDPKTKKFRSTAWTADNERASSTMYAPIKAGKDTVALVVSDDWERKDELHANARLIASAPELLAIAQRLVSDGLSTSLVNEAKALILKATGGQS